MSEFEIEDIERIIEAAKRNGLTGVRIKTGAASVRIELHPNSGGAPTPALASPDAEAPMQTLGDVVIRSPMVGFFRTSAASAAEGDRVATDTVIGSIEALGLPNEVPAGATGILDEFLVEDGQPVEYGQAIARIRP
jgi:acetyl-CoA carboxylase biotin carboxyl carrier protein